MVVLARLLTPDDYGIIAMVVAFTSLAGLFRDFGLSAAIIQVKDLSDKRQSNFFWLNVSIGILLAIVIYASAPLISLFYDRNEVGEVARVLAFSFIIVSVGTQFGARLIREMKFGRKAIATISGGLVNLAISILFALYGGSYWSLVAGTLSGQLITTVCLILLSPLKVKLPSKDIGIKKMIIFGANITAFDIINYLHRNLDKVLIGRFYGSEQLGLYNRAYDLLLFPIRLIRGPISSVAFPALSRLQDSPYQFKKFYRQATSIIALASIPICAFAYTAAESLIIVALGTMWVDSAQIFKVLAIAGMLQPSASLRGTVLLSYGRGARYFNIGLIQATLTSIGFIIGIGWGPLGVAWSYAVSVHIAMPFMFIVAFKNTPLKGVDYMQSIMRPFLAAILATVVCAVAKLYVIQLNSEFYLLVVLLVLFVSIYISSILLMPGGKKELISVIKLFKELR